MPQEILFSLPTVLLVITFCVALCVIGLVLKDKIQGKDDKTTYKHKRTILIYIAAMVGYIGAILNKVLLFTNEEVTFYNFLIPIIFYLSMAVLAGYFAFKKPVKEDTNGYTVEDYYSVQFITVLLSSFLPLILLR